ncbi:MAG: electron transfer flavoprotein subunit beta/FixA family protein [Candidatus Latescibacterota bacterium]|nr:MAG: electron transfer flavoprotein subunit beta/FixA family protein [Candidatus Latescibacterota bacterium]
MKAIVCVKEVPETPEGVRVTEEGSLAPREDASFLIDPIGPYAIETALQLRDKKGGSVVVLSVGSKRAEKILKESAFAVGADDAFLLSDAALEGGDPHATARVLAAAVAKAGGADLILCGDRAADDNASTVGPALGRLLGWPVLTSVAEVIDFDPDGGKIRVARALESGREIVEAALPAVVTVIKGIYQPRYPSLLGIRKAAKREVPVWTAADLGLDPASVGASGSPTRVRKLSPPPPPGAVEMLSGEPEATAAALVAKIMDAKIL